MKKFTGIFLLGGDGMLHVLRRIGLSMVAVLLAVMAFGQAQDTYHVWADTVVDCYRADNNYKVQISFRDFVKIDSFVLFLEYDETKFDADKTSFQILRSEITGATVTESTEGVLVFTWDVAWTGSDPYRTIQPNNDKIAVMELNFKVRNYLHFYDAVPAPEFRFTTDLVWSDDTEFWNDEGQISQILTSDITGDGMIDVTQGWESVGVDVTPALCDTDNVVATVVNPANVAGMTYSWNGNTYTDDPSTNIIAPASDVTLTIKQGNCISYLHSFDVHTPASLSYGAASPVYVKCPGGLGDIEVNATGGTPAYTYYIVPATSFPAVITGDLSAYASSVGVFQRSPGTYYVAVQDANGCANLADQTWWSQVVVIDNNTPWGITVVSKSNALCYGAGNGEFELAFAGATSYADGNYSVSVNGGAEVMANSLDMNDLYAGDYYVYVRDSLGCIWDTTITISEPLPIDFEVGHTDASCEAAIGELWVTPGSISGGSGTYGKWWYSIYPDFSSYTEIASVADTATGIPAGVYYVRIFDDEGCFADYINNQGDNSIKILTLEFEVNIPEVQCNGESVTATIDLVSGDGSHTLKYSMDGSSWQDGNSFEISLDPDEDCKSFTFYAKDVTIDCVYEEVKEVCQPEKVNLEVLTDLTLPPTCPESTDGQIVVRASGGTISGDGMYMFKFDDRQWEHAPYYNTFASDEGEHTIIVKDDNGCTDTVKVTLYTGVNQICFTDTIWNDCPADKINLFNNDSTDMVGHPWWKTELNDGWLTCFSWVGDTTIGDPGSPTHTSVSYWTSDEGWITLPVQGAQWEREPVLYWTDIDPTGNADPAVAVVAYNQVVDTTSTFGAGTYWLAAKDEWGCYSNVERIVVVDPEPLEVELTVEPAICYEQESGQITLEAFNGRFLIPNTDSISPYSDRRYEYILVSQPDIFNATNWPLQVTWRPFTNHDMSNDSLLEIDVQQGDYWIAVRDFCGLEEWGLIWQSGRITVEGPPELLLNESVVVVGNETCNYWDVALDEAVSSKDGSITIPQGAVTGGFPPYKFTLTGVDTTLENTSGVFTDLEAGSYTVVISDSSDCPTYVYDFSITKPCLLKLGLEHVNASCFGKHDGLLVYNIFGGSGSYEETTNNVGEYEDPSEIPEERWYTVIPKDTICDESSPQYVDYDGDCSNCWIRFDRSVQAGEYEVYIRDENGCITGPYYRTVEEPAALGFTVDTENPSCSTDDTEGTTNDGSIEVWPNGGWESSTDGFEYTVKLYDGNGDLVETTTLDSGDSHTFLGLTADDYTVVVYEQDSSITPDYPINQKEDYLDFWPDSYSLPYQNPNVTAGYPISGVTICNASDVVTLSDDPIVYEDAEYTDVLCHNTASGKIYVYGVTGGTPPYSFMLQGPVDYANNNVRYTPGVDDPQDEWTWDDLVYGHYTIHIYDSKDCHIYWESGEIENADTLALSAELIENITCSDSLGIVELAASGGTGAGTFQYALVDVDDNEHFPQPNDAADALTKLEWQDSNVFNVPAGVWIAFVKDANNCVQGWATDSVGGAPILQHRVVVIQPDPVVASGITSTDVQCWDGNDGIINVDSISGGNGPVFTAVVTGTDYEGNEVYKAYANLDGSDNTLTGLKASTDKMPGDELTSGDYYSIVFYDSEGCPSSVDTVAVYQPEEFEVILDISQAAFICPDDLAGIFEIVVVSGGVPFTTVPGGDEFLYKWASYTDSTMSTVLESTDYAYTSTFLGYAGRFYKVWAQDANGCITTSTKWIPAPKQIVYEVSDHSCYDDSGASAHIEILDGNEGRTYKLMYTQITGVGQADVIYTSPWMDFDGDTIINTLSYGDVNQDGGHYIFTIKDNLGCLAPDTFITFVPVQHELTLAIGSVSSDGLTATVTANGGIPPYKYQLNNGAWQAAAVFTDLPAGTNTITVMDAHECSASADIDVDDISVTADPASGSSVASTFTVDFIFNRDVIVPTDGVTVTGATTSSVTGTGSTYTVSITADELATVTVTLSNTIEDNAGNAFAGGTFTYTVNDTEAPTVVSVSPTGDVGDDTTFDLVLTLSENVIAGAGNMVVYNGTTAVATFGPGDVTISGSTVSVAVSLDKYTSYFVQVDAGFVTDASGNGIAGITSPTDWAFNTGDFNVAVEQLDVAKLKVYPNPFSDYIKIDNNQILTRVIISNIAGQRVIDIVNPEHEVRTPNLVSGVYVVTMFTENGVAKTERIVKR